MFKPMLPLAVLALAGCQNQADSTPKPSKAPAAKVVGAAESCIPIVSIRSSRVHDDQTIDFDLGGGKIYRNTLPHSCPSLGFEEAFTYETSLSRLCSTDIIYVLQRVGGTVQRGAGCGLGQFVPVELEKK
jgi:hypothetical protein